MSHKSTTYKSVLKECQTMFGRLFPSVCVCIRVRGFPQGHRRNSCFNASPSPVEKPILEGGSKSDWKPDGFLDLQNVSELRNLWLSQNVWKRSPPGPSEWSTCTASNTAFRIRWGAGMVRRVHRASQPAAGLWGIQNKECER